ncbi:polyketide synthase [Emericellopsis atlantica]|uniref:Polyketide synthase n=1 Tax=Emericellopsis atlantica TaxID=2614577 RepID=A0A9P7ZCL7_9HYPO|nr:polyketide synthase [Emericellopsis atlantica]KAG9249431.1 polyketide synthase [Emericellopsis atlantica]
MAVVGMAMRLPGKVRNGTDFWELLTEKKSGLCAVPKDRFNIDAFHDPDGATGTLRMRQGYYLDDVDIQQFDTSFFSLSKTELERLDPQQRQLLEVTYECMEDAGATNWRGGNTGCYVGVFAEDWQDLNAKETQHRGGYRATGYGDFVLANRISYEYDLRGPSMTIKTACSSSLVGLDLACQAIRNGECDNALICGTSLIFSPTMALALSDQGVLSPRGISRSFDASADGYGRGEAVNAIYIKKLSQALEDGDNIRAVIRGTAVNTDGRTQGMLIPSPVAQEKLIRQTYRRAGISDLSKTAFVECHGTGTVVGDPLETSAVGKCFGDQGMFITSVKPNVGHGEGAAGLTSLIKAILALEHRQIPPNIHFDTPNPDIPWKECNLQVPVDTEKWPRDRAERVSVNSFGIGGESPANSDAQVILESIKQYHSYNQAQITPPSIDENPVDDLPTGTDRHLLLLSAKSDAALSLSTSQHCEYLKKSDAALRDVAYTLANRRDHKAHRGYLIASDSAVAESTLLGAATSSPRVAWVFTGQGAQWPEMGAELIDTNQVFHDTIKRLDSFLASLPNPPAWTIETELRKVAGDSRVQKAEMGHPLSIAVQIGLINVLSSWGLKPDLVLGHSSGEMSAAYASGSITAEAAMAAATFRGTTSGGDTPEKSGSMAALGLSAEDTRPLLEEGVIVACENSPSSVTISGDSDKVEIVVAKVKELHPGVLSRLLRVEKAFHSHHMLEYGPLYEEHIQPFITSVNPEIPFYSSVTGKRLQGDGCLGAKYWRQNMESPVLFNGALREALASQPADTVLIEIGPHPALKGPIGQILRDIGRTDVHLGTLVRDRSCEESILHLAGRLFQHNVDVDLAALAPGQGNHVHDMPSYPWKQEALHWAESRVARDWRFRQHKPHELLGVRVTEVINETCWRNKLSLSDVTWLEGHKVDGQIVMPGAGYVCMAGEAIRQLHEETTYTIKNMSISAGLVLDHDKVVELVTRLTPVTVDSADESTAYSFTVTSYDGTRWTKHCSGEVKPSVDKSVNLESADEWPAGLPRKVDEDDWYALLNRAGFNYTGLFRGLKALTSATVKDEALATVETKEANRGDRYSLHPAVIDQCFQLFTVSAYRGLARNCTTIAVPTFIRELIVRPTQADMRVGALIESSERGSFVGSLSAKDGGHTILSLKGFKASALTSNDGADESAPLITQMHWKPHQDFVNMERLLLPREACPDEWPLVEELMLLCSLDHLDMIKVSESTPSHLIKFFEWMQKYVARYQQGQAAFLKPESQLCELDSAARLARINTIVGQVSQSQYAVFATAIHRLFMEAKAIFAGEAHPLHILLKDNVLGELYAVGDALDFTHAVRTLAHTNPRMRVLEVGAGTGGTTSKVLAALMSPYGERMYSSYLYTDISLGFMTAAKERFAHVEGIEYASFDITQDPISQGLAEGGFDLIVGSNVVHATPSLHTSLKHLRQLLSPGGRLFLEELCPDAKFINYVMGFLPGWWLGEEDSRPDEPYVSRDRWSKELVAAGFNEPDAFVLDGIAPYHQSAGILASPCLKVAAPTSVTLLCCDEGPYYHEVKASLVAQGMTVHPHRLGDVLPRQDIVSILDLQQPILHDFSEQSFHQVLEVVKSLQSKLVWVTRSVQVSCQDPRTAMSLGFARTARNELSINFYTVEIDDKTERQRATDCVAQIFLKVQATEPDAESMDPDWEYAICDGETLVPRLHWQTMHDASASNFDDTKLKIPLKKLGLRAPGLLHTMGWHEGEAPVPSQGQVVVQTKAVGMNFRDVLIALGVLDNSTSEIGLEGCGIVTAVGQGAEKLKVGDTVIYMSSGCFATQLALSETLCVKIDDSLTFEQGAGLPCVYATAAMALTDKANLQAGQTVLIHSACGGVGLAAIQIAQMLGAEIYCTVSNEEKIRYIMNNCGIPRDHIYNSRDASFLRDVMDHTKGKGVDVVLNSLSGDLLHASWECVAEFGTMIEIGKRDFRRRAKLSMESFEQNRTFVGLDLWQISQVRPEKAAELLERCVGWIRDGLIKPGAIAKTWEASQVQDAFRYMQGGRHIGKIIVKFPEDATTLESTELISSTSLRSDRSYLLVGGLGGLGRAVATWMVERGARHLIFLSRSAKSGGLIEDFQRDLESQGCEVQLAQGSVGVLEDVQAAIQGVTKPIAGVLNLSMVLRDMSLAEMSFDDWTAAVAPKVQGTWNLHQCLMGEQLDFFVLASSYSGIVGQWGQANYAAANTFLDAFVQYRHAQGHAASVIDIGVMGEVGFVWKNRDILDHFKRSGMRILKETELLDAMNLAIQRSKPTPNAHAQVDVHGAHWNPSQIILGFCTSAPIAAPNTRVVWKADVRAGVYHNMNGQANAAAKATTEQDGIASLLALAASRPSVLEEEKTTETIAAAVAKALTDFLIQDEDSIKVEQSPEHIGVDSLVAMELRNWVRQKFAVETNVMSIVQSASLLDLADNIRESLMERFEGQD